ncbi:sensor histidine kinase [Clostridium vitabionis]|uniref:sensor histidine kinase n=1 Tax=Clostridium vitabionis TaxID=2784388 RepID=UPI00188CF14B|nr:HAMP domain-containing sensor histidine kinase [Clostridium vitabionis]
MIKKLQRKFILLATAAVVLLLVAALGTVNLVNFWKARDEAMEVLDSIADNGGVLPDIAGNHELRRFYDAEPEIAFQTRYFSVTLDSDLDVVSVDTDHIAAISESEAREYALNILAGKKTSGYLNGPDNAAYCYTSAKTEDGGYLVVTLDCTRYLRPARLFARYSLVLGIACILLYMGILTLLSRRLLQPIIRNMQNQKQFITNAGHELKTPIAVISANTEVLEMINGKNEWTESIMNQVKRLTGLVNELISLAKVGERVDIPLGPASISAEAEAAASEFRVVAEQQQKKLTAQIAPGLVVRAESGGLRELVSILMDNAVKYCDDGGTISILLEKAGRNRNIRLMIANDFAEGQGVDCSRFFERFYRQDESHSASRKAGYGIGLSMAEGLVKMFNGKISAAWKDGMIRFTVVLPLLREEAEEPEGSVPAVSGKAGAVQVPESSAGNRKEEKSNG